MTDPRSVSPGPPDPRHPRDPGDAWVEGPDGARYWGRFGAAGVVASDADRGILLQHRAEWSHFGGTWGIPGGARRQGEDALTGALREANEEAGVPAAALQPVFTSVLDLGFWSYTTVAARVTDPFDAVVGDAESLALDWVPADEVESLPLHPAFARAWPDLRVGLERRVTLVVDAANVVGSRPDGWWRDRRGAAERLLGELGGPAAAGIRAEELGMPGARWWPRVVVVVEGQARGAEPPAGSPDALAVRVAERDGDQAIVDAVAEVRAPGELSGTQDVPGEQDVIVVTADRELRERVEALGASVRGPGWLFERIAEA